MLCAVYQTFELMYRCVGQAQVYGFSFFTHIIYVFMFCSIFIVSAIRGVLSFTIDMYRTYIHIICVCGKGRPAMCCHQEVDICKKTK